MITTVFNVDLSVINKLIKSVKLFQIILLFLLGFSTASYANSSHPFWLQESLDKADKLNDKNPILALELIQSLLKEHKNQLSPAAKAAVFSRVAEYQYYIGEIEESLKYVNLYYELSPNLATNDGISVLITHGGLLDSLGKPKEALDLYYQAEKNAKVIENKKLLGESYAAIGNSFSANHNDSEALKYFHQAYLHIKESGDELELAYLKIQMARSYSYIYDDEKSVILATEAIKYFNEHEYYFDELFAQGTLAQTYTTMKKYDKAIIVYQRVITLSKKVEKENYVGVAYLGLAKAYYYKKQDAKARHYFALYQELNTASQSPFSQMGDLLFSAKLALSDKDIPLAQKRITQTESILFTLEKDTVLSWYVDILQLKADIAVFNNDYKSAYLRQKEAKILFASYQNREREEVRSKYKVMFDTDQALLQNQILERDKLLDKAELESSKSQQKIQTLLIFGISIFAIGATLFIYLQFQNSKRLHKLANTDTLTNLSNRRHTFVYAESMLAQAKKDKGSFALIIFDIDHFKRINDTYGHAAGDVALKNIAEIASEYVRNNDILGRIGGEEFLVILPGTSAKQAFVVAERIRQGIVEKDIILSDEVVNISASFGIAQLAQNHPNFNQIFHEADTALYQAKNSGRNCVAFSG